MPIVAKTVIEARRAAARARAEAIEAAAPPAAEPPVGRPRLRIRKRELVPSPPAVAEPSSPPLPPPPSPSPQRGHATRDESGKWQATGDYDVGYCRPPEATRFKKGGKPGPGRPKGSVSHDTMVRRALDAKQTIRIDGKEKKLSRRELVVTRSILDAVAGKDRDARNYVLKESARLYGAPIDAPDTGGTEAALNASDALSLEEFIADLRENLRAEVRAELERELRQETGEDA